MIARQRLFIKMGVMVRVGILQGLQLQDEGSLAGGVGILHLQGFTHNVGGADAAGIGEGERQEGVDGNHAFILLSNAER
jgi:hypothetical protein